MMLDFNIKVGYYDLFHGSVIIPPAYEACRGVYSLHYSSVRPSFHASVLHCDLYFGPVILLYILMTV